VTHFDSRGVFSRLCERAFLLGFRGPGETIDMAEAHLTELRGLVESLGILVVGTMLIALKVVKTRSLIGRGKVEEVARRIDDVDADLVVSDADLSPAQQRNLENEWDITVIDRCELILDIFANRASTREAVIQVALARMQYTLPRLTRAWTHLSRQRGGARGNRGKGETQLESDHRLVQDRIASLKKDLIKVREQRDARRKRRFDNAIPSVSLVGYTNAGKSSLLNSICGSDVLVEDRLFATLDPTTRSFDGPGNRRVLFTDTVGFIRKLPHALVDAFRSTLEEAIFADVILHVADAGSSELDQHIATTESVLMELGAGGKARILALNKADALSPNQREDLALRYPAGIFVSARRGLGLDSLTRAVFRALDVGKSTASLFLPPHRWNLRARLYRESRVLEETFDKSGARLLVRISAEEKSRFADYILDA